MIDHLVAFGRFIDFAWRVLLALPGGLLRPSEVVRQFERVAWESVALVGAAGLSIGLVSWLQTRRILVQYGLESTLPSLLAAAVLIETGPILASLLVAGRMGAGLAAELGTMVLTEEIDAREVLGARTIPGLVVPRVLACLLAVPLLTVLIDASALLGGLLAETTMGSLSASAFEARALDLLKLHDVIPATLKTGVFGGLVGLVACWTGLTAERSTEAVGRAATRGVVRAMLAVFAADVVLVPVIQAFVSIAGWVD